MVNFDLNKAAMLATILGYALMAAGNLIKAAAVAKYGN